MLASELIADTGQRLRVCRRNRRWAFSTVLASVVALPIAGAQSASPPPSPSPSPSPLTTFKLIKTDCVNGFVSKSRLGKELANAAKLVGPISGYLTAHPTEASHLYAHLYGDPDLCTSLGCDSTDAEALARAREWLNARLQFGQTSDFTRSTPDTDAAKFFSTADSVDGIACATPKGAVPPGPATAPSGQAEQPEQAGAAATSGAQQAQTPTAAPPGLWDLSHFRVRGYAEQIPLPRLTGQAPPVDPYHTDVLFDTTQGAAIRAIG